jgi:hypothetical protein
MFKRVFFLNPPSYGGFSGGAGSRFQAKPESAPFGIPLGWCRRWNRVPATKYFHLCRLDDKRRSN